MVSLCQLGVKEKIEKELSQYFMKESIKYFCPTFIFLTLSSPSNSIGEEMTTNSSLGFKDDNLEFSV